MSAIRICALCALILAASTTAFAVIERGIIIREGIIYVAPDASSAKLSNVTRGREVAVVERSGNWANVVATVEVDPDQETEKNVTGWILDKGIITPATPDGDRPPLPRCPNIRIPHEAPRSRAHGFSSAPFRPAELG